MFRGDYSKLAAAKGSTTMQQTIRTLFSKPSESGTSSSKQKQVKADRDIKEKQITV